MEDLEQQPGHGNLVFGMGSEEYAIDILTVQELCGYSRVTELANTPAYFKGVVNLRGTIVPLIDLRIHFGLSEPNYDDTTVVIMVTLNGTTTGLVVDRVADVVTLDASQIKPAPALQGSSSAYIAAIASVDDRMLIMLDVATLIRDLCPAHTEPLAA